VPINHLVHAEKWDKLEIEGDIKGRDCLVRYRRDGTVLAVASIYRDPREPQGGMGDGTPRDLSGSGQASPSRRRPRGTRKRGQGADGSSGLRSELFDPLPSD